MRRNDDKVDYDETVKATSEEEAIAKVQKDAPRLARHFSAELVKPKDLKETIKKAIKSILNEGGNLGHNEISSIHQEGAYWIVTYRGSEGTTEKSFKSEEEARKFQNGLDEDTRFDFQKGGGGGKRFIPTNGIVPSKLFTSLPNHFRLLDNQLLISPEAVIALTSVERGRGGAINYKELYGKLRGYFDIKKANSSSEFGPAQTSSFLSQFKQGLKGRLEAVMTGGKEFKVWNGEGSKNEKGDFIFPLAQFKTASLQENEEGLRSQLHSLVGNEMRLGKRANMTGASNHVEEHEKAEKAVEDFLRKNPSMEEYRDKVEDHFTKLLFK